MTTADRQSVGAAVLADVRVSPMYLLGPGAFVGLGVWVMTTTQAWFLGLFALLTGVALLVWFIAMTATSATGYAGPAWWRRATGHDVVDDDEDSAPRA